MLRNLLKSKIHRARVTGANLEYTGSLTLARPLAEAADICAHEFVHITNLQNGVHWVTYVIIDPDQDDTVLLNGPAARHFFPGDEVIVLAYGLYDPEEAKLARPRLVFVDRTNRITRIQEAEPPFQAFP